LTNRLVLAFFGDDDSRGAVQHWSAAAEVVAVAIDLDGRVPLTELRDGALAAGAARCHALDVREEFAREALLPVVRAGGMEDTAASFGARARVFVARKLRDIARLEHAAVVPPDRVTPLTKAVKPAPVPPQRLDITFEAGVPVAVNGIPMTLTELLESVETITGQPAVTVLQREYALAAA
jgi:argininosuccinate synthase